MSSAGPCIGEVVDVTGGRRVLLAVFSPESAPTTFSNPASAPQHTWEREGSVSHLPAISCHTTAFLAEYLEASWSSWAAQMRVYSSRVPGHHTSMHRWVPTCLGQLCKELFLLLWRWHDFCHPTALWNISVAPGCERCPQIWEFWL